jgi:hypothetical protein
VRVFAATDDGLYTIDRDGNTKQVAPGTITALAAGPDGRMWLVVDEHRLVALRGDALDEVDDSGEQLTSVVATNDGVFVGTVGAHLLHLIDGTLARVESFEELDGRDEWTQPWGAPGDVRSFASDGNQTVYVNVHVGGVLRTHDGGHTWVQTIDPAVDVHQVALARDGRLFAATGAEGLGSSHDGGATWEYATKGLHSTYARAVAPVPDGVVVSASTGPFTREGALYVLRNGATSFERCTRGIPASFEGNIDSHCVASAGDLAVCAGPDATIYLSADRATTWRVLTSGLPQPHAVLVEA